MYLYVKQRDASIRERCGSRRQTCDALSVSRVCVLYVEARRFYGAEGRFNLPTLFVARDSIFRPVETDQNLKLGHPLDSTSGRINILPFMQNGFVVELLLSDFEGIKEPPCPDSFSCGGLDNPNVLPDTDVVSNSVVVEPSNPLLADKLAVGHKTVDAAMSKKSDESLHYSLAFLPIGISALAQQAEQQWNGNVLVGDAEGEYIDVELSELPVGSGPYSEAQPSLTGSKEKIILAARLRFKAYSTILTTPP